MKLTAGLVVDVLELNATLVIFSVKNDMKLESSFVQKQAKSSEDQNH
jgi:hypothetical protein